MNSRPESWHKQSAMPRLRLDIRYDGSGYYGWQKQAQIEHITIQSELEKAIFAITGESVKTVGSGRTDAGAHARHQVVHFDFSQDPKKYPWARALNSKLSEKIQVFRAYEAPDEFHAIKSAEHKHYTYFIWNSPIAPVFRRNYSWWHRRPLSRDWLNECSSQLLGKHDFSAFQNAGTDLLSTTRTLTRAEWISKCPESLEFHIEGDGFLKQMVRNLVGTQVELFFMNAQPTEITEILKSGQRQMAGVTAPAHGLFLNAVSYPQNLDNRCRKL